MATLYFFIVALFIALAVWSYSYKKNYTRMYVEIDEDADLPESNFVTVNGCGRTVLGGFKIFNSDLRLYYVAFTMFGIPLFPLKCIIAEEYGTSYNIYGVTNMKFKEVITCFAFRIGWLVATVMTAMFFFN